MDLETFFLTAFLAGLSLSVLGFLLGAATSHIHLPGAEHLPFGLHVGSPDHSWDAGVSPFNFSTLTTFVAWFGGAGWLAASDAAPVWLAFVAATGAGVFGSALVFLVLARIIAPGQTPPLRLEDYRMEGTVARVSSPIYPGRVGEITFVRNGGLRSEPAREERGDVSLPRNTEVVVVRYDRGVAYVESVDRLLAERDALAEAREEGGERSALQ